MKISKIYSKVLVLLLALCVTGSIDLTARAASSDEKETYTVRLFSGAHSTLINGSEMMSYEVAYDSPLPFSTRDVVQLGAESKYYVKDIRESGKDNAETLEEGYRVREDRDYVVTYGVLGNSVSYTVQFQTEDGTDLAPPETYYGNIGDRPVVAFLYIDGYLPQAYNLTGTLQSDPAANVFTFVYTPISEEAAAAGAEAGAAAGGTTTTPPAAGAGAGLLSDAVDDLYLYVLYRSRSKKYEAGVRAEESAREGDAARADPVQGSEEL